jgi:hypothetical protein
MSIDKMVNQIRDLRKESDSLTVSYSDAINSINDKIHECATQLVREIVGNTVIVPVKYYQHPIIEEWFVNESGTIFEKNEGNYVQILMYRHNMGKGGKKYDQVRLPEKYWVLYGNRNVILVHKIAYEAFHNVTTEREDGQICHIKNADDHSKSNLVFRPNDKKMKPSSGRLAS